MFCKNGGHLKFNFQLRITDETLAYLKISKEK